MAPLKPFVAVNRINAKQHFVAPSPIQNAVANFPLFVLSTNVQGVPDIKRHSLMHHNLATVCDRVT